MRILAIAVLSAFLITSHQASDLAPVGGFASVRQTSGQDPHCYGWSVKLWRHNGQLIGLASQYEGECADPPCRALTNVTHDARTGRLRFSAFGLAFDGTLRPNELTGTLGADRLTLTRGDDPMDARYDKDLGAWCTFWRSVTRCEGVTELCRSRLLVAASTPAGNRQTSDDTGIVKSVLADLVEPRREKYQPPRTIVLDRMSLARCPKSGIRACIVQPVFDQARREAAMGSWGFDLVAAFEKHAAERTDLAPRFETFAHREFLFDAPDATRRAHPTPLLLAISQPIVVDARSLIVVQFARTWTWLVFLSKDSSGWHVTKTITIGVS